MVSRMLDQLTIGWRGGKRRNGRENARVKVEEHVAAAGADVWIMDRSASQLFAASSAHWPRINMKIGLQPLPRVAFAALIATPRRRPGRIDSIAANDFAMHRLIFGGPEGIIGIF